MSLSPALFSSMISDGFRVPAPAAAVTAGFRAGDIVVVGADLVGVAGNDSALANTVAGGSLNLFGIYDVPKGSAEVIPIGAKLAINVDLATRNFSTCFRDTHRPGNIFRFRLHKLIKMPCSRESRRRNNKDFYFMLRFESFNQLFRRRQFWISDGEGNLRRFAAGDLNYGRFCVTRIGFWKHLHRLKRNWGLLEIEILVASLLGQALRRTLFAFTMQLRKLYFQIVLIHVGHSYIIPVLYNLSEKHVWTFSLGRN